MRVARSWLWVLVAILAAATPARAATVFTVPQSAQKSDGGGALVTPQAMYTIRYRGRHLVRTGPRGSRRVLSQFDRLIRAGRRTRTHPDFDIAFDILASSRWLAVALQRIDTRVDAHESLPTTGRTTLQVARPGGRARTLLRCRKGDTEPLALRGSLLVYRSCGGATILVRDLDHPSRVQRLVVPANVAAFAGPRLVLLNTGTGYQRSQIGVYDLADERSAFTGGDSYATFATRVDGTVLLVEHGTEAQPCSGPASLLDPTAASPRALSYRVCPGGRPSIAGAQLIQQVAPAMPVAQPSVDVLRPLEGGEPRVLNLGVGWFAPMFVSGGLVRLQADTCGGESFTFVELPLLLGLGPGPPPDC